MAQSDFILKMSSTATVASGKAGSDGLGNAGAFQLRDDADGVSH